MHRFTNQLGVELIKQFEGFRSKPYICAGGHLTIGYGHKLTSDEQYNYLDQEAAEEMLKQDLLQAERAVLKNICVRISDNQFAALVSFTFNLGAAVLQRSTLRQKINSEYYDEAAFEFNRWIYTNGKILSGLIKRRKAESELFLS